MTAFRVIIPDEKISLVEFRQKDMPGLAAINSALRDFEPKLVFAWHLSVMVRFKDLMEGNGMPSRAERAIVDPFGDGLDAQFKGPATKKPNALFLARITWNGTRELIYRVFDPEPANGFLQEMIAAKSYPRDFDFRIDHDPEWKLAEWHLSAVKRKLKAETEPEQ